MLPRARRLTPEQKREFALGWLNWLGAESLGVGVAILNLVWVPVVAFAGIAIPDKILTLPIMAAFVVSFVHFIALYRLRVPIPAKQMVGAVLAAMSVQFTVARAVGYGIWTESAPFTRTAKGGTTRKGPDFPAFWEGVMAALLLIGAALVVITNYKQIREINLFAGVLVIQSLPFLAAIALALIEGSRFNEFAYWRSVEAKVAGNLQGPPPVVAEAPAQVPVLPDCRCCRPTTGSRRSSPSGARPSERSKGASTQGARMARLETLEPRRADGARDQTRSAVSTSLTQYEVPIGITSSLKS